MIGKVFFGIGTADWTQIKHNQLRQHGSTPKKPLIEYQSGESESKSESWTSKSESKSESPKNGTRVGLESGYYNLWQTQSKDEISKINRAPMKFQTT